MLDVFFVVWCVGQAIHIESSSTSAAVIVGGDSDDNYTSLL